MTDEEASFPGPTEQLSLSSLLFPSTYYEGSPDYFMTDETWMTHSSYKWMYCTSNNLYYHTDSNRFFFFDPNVNRFQRVATESDEPSFEQQGFAASNAVQEGEKGEVEDGYFVMDFESDIAIHSSELMSAIQGKYEREDRHLTKESLLIQNKTAACCLCSSIFDGHGGSYCAEYCIKYIPKNLMSCYQSAATTLDRKLEKKTADLGRVATSQDLGLTHSKEIEALRRGLYKAFQQTDSNYLSIAQTNGLNDGCTALVVLLFGPDEDGSLKLLTAHVGDCRAVLCRGGTAVRLTEDHKPDRKDEKERIESIGGKVVPIKGVWRVMATVGNKAYGLSTARSIGDVNMKRPKCLVPSTPDLKIINVDFYRDLFVILGSDGIWDVIDDQDACDIVIKETESSNLQEAADTLVSVAETRGSLDDKTATIIYFTWSRLFSGAE